MDNRHQIYLAIKARVTENYGSFQCSKFHFYDNNIQLQVWYEEGVPGGSDGKQSVCNAGDKSLILGVGRFPREGNGNPFQYSWLLNSMDRGAWQAIVYRVTKGQTRLSD